MNVEEIILNYLENNETISLDEAAQIVYRTYPNVPRSTIRWRLHDMAGKGKLRRLRRGIYAISSKTDFSIHISDRLVAYYTAVTEQLPFIHICVWSSEAIQNFSHHHPKTNFDIVEVEKDGVEAVRDILLNLDIRASTYDDFPSIQPSLIGGERVVVIKRLISEAPVMSYSSIVVPRIEKILVDLVCDEKIFQYLHGSEMFYIYSHVVERYNLQYDTLLRYASRRGVSKKVDSLLQQISGNKS